MIARISTTKMMRGNDPKDMDDIAFLIATDQITATELQEVFKTAIIPDVAEIMAAFQQDRDGNDCRQPKRCRTAFATALHDLT